MNTRQKQVLKLIVEEYVKTSQPVSSRDIVEMMAEPISSATVRNDMADLTEAGLVAQPHTSAGRIPTEAGFKFYVGNMLVEQKELSRRQQEVLSKHFKNLRSLQERFREAARLLSELSGNVGLLIDDEQQVYMSGLANLPKLPEFRDAVFGEEFMNLLEDPAHYLGSLSPALNDQPQVLMGADNPLAHRSSIVITRFGTGGKRVISVIGPVRMPYGKALPAVEFIKNILEEDNF